MDRRSARDQFERPLVPGVSSILASEDASRNGGSGGFGEEKAQKGRVIDGTGAITPHRGGPSWHDVMIVYSRDSIATWST